MIFVISASQCLRILTLRLGFKNTIDDNTFLDRTPLLKYLKVEVRTEVLKLIYFVTLAGLMWY